MITRAKWRQIADHIQDQVTHGNLRPGDRVPGEVELAGFWHVARMTARTALVHLEQTGVLSPGRPRRVARPEPLTVGVTRVADRTWAGESPTSGADSWAGDMAAAGREPAQRIEVIAQQASPGVAARLGVGEGDTVIARRLLRQAGGQPHNLITFWFPAGVAQGTVLGSPGSIEEGSVAWLETRHGLLGHEVEVSARQPVEDETAALGIPPGVPVLVVWRTSRSPARPVVTSVAVYPADRTVLRLEL